MKSLSILGSTFALLAFGSLAPAASIVGTINFSSGANGGVILQDVFGNATTSIPAATGVKTFLVPEVEVGDFSFLVVTPGQAVSFPQAWIFTPSTPLAPLWSIAGPGNFAFNLSSATVVLNSEFLLISGKGTLTSPDFDPTPAEWLFTTQAVPTDGKFSWSSETKAVPELGTPALFGAALLGVCFLRRRDKF